MLRIGIRTRSSPASRAASNRRGADQPAVEPEGFLDRAPTIIAPG